MRSRNERKYRRWEQGAAAEIAMISPALAAHFLDCPLPYSKERIQAQVALLEGLRVGVQSGDGAMAVAMFDEHRPNLDAS